jgi:hypothetical protein
LAVELLRRPGEEVNALRYDRVNSPPLQSAHFLSDFYPGGTWTTSQTLELKKEDGSDAELVIGPAWTVEELPEATATAAYDLAVGLICFDRIVFPLDCVGRAHQLLGAELFWRLVAEDMFQFVQWEGVDGVMFMPPLSVITRQLNPVAGRQELATAQFELLKSKVKRVDLSGKLNFGDVCNELLASPVTRSALGVSEATPMGQIPRWTAAPVIRLVQIARVGATCQMLGLSSMKLMTGASQIAQVAFSAVAGGVLAREVAAYTLTGEFGVIPENAFTGDSQIWNSILAFRGSNEGTNLRSYGLNT